MDRLDFLRFPTIQLNIENANKSEKGTSDRNYNRTGLAESGMVPIIYR